MAHWANENFASSMEYVTLYVERGLCSQNSFEFCATSIVRRFVGYFCFGISFFRHRLQTSASPFTRLTGCQCLPYGERRGSQNATDKHSSNQTTPTITNTLEKQYGNHMRFYLLSSFLKLFSPSTRQKMQNVKAKHIQSTYRDWLKKIRFSYIAGIFFSVDEQQIRHRNGRVRENNVGYGEKVADTSMEMPKM